MIGARDGRFAGDPRHRSVRVRHVAFEPRPGPSGKITDAELIALAVAQAVTGLASDRQFLGMVRRLLAQLIAEGEVRLVDGTLISCARRPLCWANRSGKSPVIPTYSGATLEVRERKPPEVLDELVDQISLDTPEVALLAPPEQEALRASGLQGARPARSDRCPSTSRPRQSQGTPAGCSQAAAPHTRRTLRAAQAAGAVQARRSQRTHRTTLPPVEIIEQLHSGTFPEKAGRRQAFPPPAPGRHEPSRSGGRID